ncbi:RNA-binding S4 domain protein [Caldicellulosiruptor saccharolyticus DSM 8903]|uniref:RQC P-site tRNA stabilizing factor n=1 Tax=Caldicellulosiruptor saccharolyticus (strain ATCC 43494 / DSM 8903 / Tp8T 6331) TaxID=351627 RepID=A4XIT3_CALS8|nr:RNA-binding S4 domain-containing protein [Caldicellulosiruptor saccharolyticus]ABP66818.1 RNA-binding S4 domain protein [Caldicellulosiruptor saccharolyticus DSM 8903]
MRIDKYLKVSRIIKRRTLAQEACNNERVFVNGKVAKPSTEVKVGDIIEVRFGDKIFKCRVTSIDEKVQKNLASNMYEVIE